MIPDVLEVASLIGDKSRATILFSLLDGRMIPASELAKAAKISPQTASSHLAKLVEGGLLTMFSHGRHRYYMLANAEIAAVLEGMSVIAPARQVKSLRESDETKRLHYARTCYDHLAGKVGVALTEALLASGMIEPDSFTVTELGMNRLIEFGIPLEKLVAGKQKPLCRQCLDWSERRFHAAGVVGARITERLFELGWIERLPSTRAVAVTQIGKQGLRTFFGAEISTN